METSEHPTHIVLNGLISSEVYHIIKPAFGETPIPATAKVFFVPVAEITIPVGTTFQKIFNPSTGQVEDTTCVLTLVTQQQAKCWDYIPEDWKTICRLDFPQGVPDMLLTLPEIDDWFDERSRPVIVATEEFWRELNIHYERRRAVSAFQASPNKRGFVLSVKMPRNEALELNANFILVNLGLQDRKHIVYDEMTHPPDTEEPDFDAIEAAYNAIKDFTDPALNRTILNYLNFTQRAVTNVYLSVSLSRKMGQNIEVVGEEEVPPVTCPCCGYKTHEEDYSYNICPVCQWEYDSDIEDEYSGPNHMTLRAYREKFLKRGLRAPLYGDPNDPDLHLKYHKDPSSTIPTPKHIQRDFNIPR